MATRARIIEPKNSGATPLAYDLAPGQTIETLAVAADFDGTGAAGDFLPTVAFYAQDGRRLGRFASGQTVIAGDSAEATFFPFAPPVSGQGFIRFDFANQGGVLDITTNDSSYGNNGLIWNDSSTGGWLVQKNSDGPIIFQATGNGGFLVESDGNGIIKLHQTGNGGVSLQDDGDGGTVIEDLGTGGLHLHVTNGTMLFEKSAAQNFVLQTLPIADPAVSGALWNNAGVVNVSP